MITSGHHLALADFDFASVFPARLETVSLAKTAISCWTYLLVIPGQDSSDLRLLCDQLFIFSLGYIDPAMGWASLFG
jgi:hypothetical protein